MKLFYQMATLICLSTLFFIPFQLDTRIRYGIVAYTLLVTPLFIKHFAFVYKEEKAIVGSYLLFLLCTLPSLYTSVQQGKSIWQFIIYVCCFIVFVTSRYLFIKQEDKAFLGKVMVIAAMMLSVVAVYNTLFARYINYDTLGVSFFWLYYGHNHLSSILLFAVPLSYYFLLNQKGKVSRLFFQLCFYFLLFSLFVTLSRLAFVILLVVGCLGFTTRHIAGNTLRKYTIIFVLFIVGLVSIHMLGKYLDMPKSSLLNKARIVYAEKAIENGFHRPLTGFGLDTYKAKHAPKGPTAHYAHNFFFQLLSDAGIPGFIASIVLVVNVVNSRMKIFTSDTKSNSKFYFQVLSVALYSSIMNALVDFDWQLPTVFFVFWLFVGISNDKETTKEGN